MFCPRCGTQNEPGEVTCLRCGTELPTPQAGSIGEGPRPTSSFPENASTNEVTERYTPPLPPPPQTPDFDNLQSTQGYGGQAGGQNYGNMPPSYGPPGGYRIGPAHQNAPGYPGVPSYGAPPPMTGPINNYLVWSILTTILCCLPIGVVAIIYSTQVDSNLRAGNYTGALDASRKAKMWCIISASVSGFFGIIYFFFAILGAFFSH